MKYAADFKKAALTALKGRWGTAVLAGFLAALLGGTASDGVKFEWDEMISDTYITQPGIVLLIVLAALLVMCIYLVLGSVVSVGYAKFQLELMDRKVQLKVGTLFRYFEHWKTALATYLLKGLYIFLWTLLLIIPGFIAGYGYAMTNYILAEHPELTAREAIKRSEEMMDGNRVRLFCLHISFIGWSLLSTLTLGIGNLWLTPYRHAAEAAFYLDLVNKDKEEASDQPLISEAPDQMEM